RQRQAIMQDQSEKWLRVLGLAHGATEQTIKEAYRDLVKVWHPDRFGTDPRLRQKAEEKLRELNSAFEYLQNYRPHRERSAGDASGSRSADKRFEPAFTSPTMRAHDLRATPSLWKSRRMAITLILAATIGAIGVTAFLAGGRLVDKSPAFP